MLINRLRLSVVGIVLIGAAFLLASCAPNLFNLILDDALPKYGSLTLTTGTVELVSGTGTYQFSPVVRADGAGGDSLSTTITLVNSGTAPLTVSLPTLSAGDVSHFTLNTSVYVTTLGVAGADDDSTSFDITFDPLAVGGLTATVSITSNAPEISTYTIDVSGNSAWWGIQSIIGVGDPATAGKWDFGDLFVDGRNVFVVYTDAVTFDLRILGSYDGGLTWPLDKTILAYDDVTEWGSNYAAVHVSGDNISVAYQYYNQPPGPIGELWFTRSTDGGDTWATDEMVDDTGYDVGTFPSIAVNGSSVYIAHYDNYTSNRDLRFARSIDNGANWPTNTTIQTTDRPGEFNSMVNIGDTLYVSYYEYVYGLLRFARSVDGGDTWDLQTVDGGPGWPPDMGFFTSIAADGTNVYISHFDWTTGIFQLMFARSPDDGVTWDAGDLRTVDSTYGTGYFSSIGSFGNDVYIAHYYWDTSNDLKFARSTDGGATWPTENFRLIDTADDVGMYADLEVDPDGFIYILYYDRTNGTLKLAKSVDGGDTW